MGPCLKNSRKSIFWNKNAQHSLYKKFKCVKICSLKRLALALPIRYLSIFFEKELWIFYFFAKRCIVLNRYYVFLYYNAKMICLKIPFRYLGSKHREKWAFVQSPLQRSVETHYETLKNCFMILYIANSFSAIFSLFI